MFFYGLSGDFAPFFSSTWYWQLRQVLFHSPTQLGSSFSFQMLFEEICFLGGFGVFFHQHNLVLFLVGRGSRLAAFFYSFFMLVGGSADCITSGLAVNFG